MSAGDLALARSGTQKYDLAIGEPVFLQKIFKAIYPSAVDASLNLRYPDFGGDRYLKAKLTKFYPGKRVVITNGAKQGLLAAIHAIKTIDGGKTSLCHKSPYWPSYPGLAAASGLQFVAIPYDVPEAIQVVTSPNNPDGVVTGPYVKQTVTYDIWDAAYANAIYGPNATFEPQHRISVWSAAKQFGLSGYRVGWLVTADDRLAAAAAAYVEQATSGVCNLAQEAFWLTLVKSESPDVNWARLQTEARQALSDTNKVLMQLSDHFRVVGGFADNAHGMFNWLKLNDPEKFLAALKRADVKVVGGLHCGGPVDCIRVTLGVGPQVMQEAVNAIQAELKENKEQ